MATIDHTIASSDRQQSPSAIDMALARVYTLNWEFIVYTVIFVLAMFTRFWDLGERVMSHDESLHT
jgi:predicted membrane-bound mannosyltransferase